MTRSNVLIVDDIPENIAVLAGMLSDHYRVIFATNGPDALDITQKQKIDLILLDVMMPGMDGYEVCRRLKSDLVTRPIPVIFVTALGEASDEAHGLDLGAADYLHKPCHAAIVRQRVQMHLERSDQLMLLEHVVRERTRELHETRLEIVRRLGRAAEYRDNETGMHVIRMSKASHLLARAAGLPDAQADLLLDAAPMHDIGKIGIPDRVLIKPGPLDADEWALMKTHPLIGAEIIGGHGSDLLRMARTVSLTHHEKWNGSGYPHGLAGADIPVEGRIVTIADVFDALTSERPYKPAWSVGAAIEYMGRQSGISFDPQLLELFFGLIPQIEQIRQKHADTAGNGVAGRALTG